MARLTQSQIKTILSWSNINQPRNEAEARLHRRAFLKLANGYAKVKKKFKTGRFKGYYIMKLADHEYLVTPDKKNWILN